MIVLSNTLSWILSFILILSSLGVILVRKPVHASLFFLLTLLILATIYLELSAQFIAIMQILVYAGAILVIFMFVIVLFQDAHQQIAQFPPKTSLFLLSFAASFFFVGLAFFGTHIASLTGSREELPVDYGTVQSLGKLLYMDFFFPFEAVVWLFLIALVGVLHIGKKVK